MKKKLVILIIFIVIVIIILSIYIFNNTKEKERYNEIKEAFEKAVIWKLDATGNSKKHCEENITKEIIRITIIINTIKNFLFLNNSFNFVIKLNSCIT